MSTYVEAHIGLGKELAQIFMIKLESYSFEDWAMKHVCPCHENENSWQFQFKFLWVDLWYLIMEITPHKFSPVFDKMNDILFIFLP